MTSMLGCCKIADVLEMLIGCTSTFMFDCLTKLVSSLKILCLLLQFSGLYAAGDSNAGPSGKLEHHQMFNFLKPLNICYAMTLILFVNPQ
jgi:hypothetical protein